MPLTKSFAKFYDFPVLCCIPGTNVLVVASYVFAPMFVANPKCLRVKCFHRYLLFVQHLVQRKG